MGIIKILVFLEGSLLITLIFAALIHILKLRNEQKKNKEACSETEVLKQAQK
jgi:hypothetical protein